MKSKVQSPMSNVHRARFDRAWQGVEAQLDRQTRFYIALECDDERLIHLARSLHHAGGECLALRQSPATREESLAILQCSLAGVAAFAALWSFAGDLPAATEAIWAERERQRALQRQSPGKYLVDVAHPVPDAGRKFRVLFEEAGEVAKAIDDLERAGRSERKFAAHHLQTELVQVAAVAVAWLESFEPRIRTDETRIGGGR